MKRWIALLLAVWMALSCVGCGALDDDVADEDDDKPKSESQTQSGGGSKDSSDAAQGLSMRVDRNTGKLTVKRAPLPSGSSKGSKGKWTLFVYLCGTDLETEAGSATDDLIEMLDGASGKNVRFVVETGGANEWLNNTVDSGKLQRYLVEKEDIKLVDEQPLDGMGRGDTFADFLRWGVKNYASEHMGVILWNHGGGSITGVCFDETDDFDSLSLRELDAALLDACGDTGRKFDFIGFDACLMGTLETANILASYADYMIASEEVEPGSGWNFTAIGRYLGENPGTDVEQLGIVICDSFYESCAEIEADDLCTLSVIDLAKLDDLLVVFNDFSRGLYTSAADAVDRAAMIRGIGKADNFGGNNRTEGYTNMVDMGGLVAACEDRADNAKEVLAALDDAVVYSVCGSAHKGVSGLSMYYPLSVQGSEELSIFADICPSPYYLSFVDRQSKGTIDIDAVDDYDDDFWFDDDDWFWGLEDELDDYWDYLDGYEPTGESPYITFDIEPFLDDEGDFWFALDDNGLENAEDVYGIVYELSEDGEDIIELGQTYDITADWEDGVFIDDFDGWWLSLPDGQNLAVYIVEATDTYLLYTSPIRLNGEDTNLRFRLDYEKMAITIDGTWSGVTEYGAASRQIVKLKDGDVIVPIYNAYSIASDDEFVYRGSEYVVDGELEITYDLMEDGDYLFAFNINDIFGDYYLTDFTLFTVEDGEVWYDTE